MPYEIDFLAVGDGDSSDAIALRFGNLSGPRAHTVERQDEELVR